MPILTLLKRVKDNLGHAPHPVLSQEQALRRSYLFGLAMQAHSDGVLVPEERRHFLEMADLFEVPGAEAEQLLKDAAKPEERAVHALRDHLAHSKHKFYFILDLQIMAHQDHEVKAVESEVVRRFGDILDVSREDREFLVQLADAVADNDPAAKDAWCRNFFKRDLAEEAAPDDFTHYTG